MSNLTLHREQSPGTQAIAPPLPAPRNGPINIRLAVQGDFAFIDALQKKHSKMVGFLMRPALEKHIELGRILIAEHANASVGYCLSQDRYFRRDDCGLVSQLNVVQTKQRGLIGATLIKEVFHRASYACKLFSCWCAQDLEANYFWESLGFVPLAFRTGSRKVKRVDGTVGPRIHIFWQRRIREGDLGPGAAAGGTPYWFPAETGNGAIGENRLVLPIPPGTRWQDAKPAVLPGAPGMERLGALPAGKAAVKQRKPRSVKKKAAAVVPQKASTGLWFAPPPGIAPTKEEIAKAKAERKAKPAREKFKNDPALVEAARELSAKYLEQVNASMLLLHADGACGKYDVSRQLESAPSCMNQMKIEQLPAANGVAMLEAA